jgi:threonine dehydrogenase-like Zn-dependent dehydrogenase
MQAGVLHGFGDLRIEEVDDVHAGPGEIAIDVSCLQLSVTECALIAGEDVYGRASVGRLLEDGPQRLFGHEFCGVVAELGPGVTGPAVGTFATSIEILPCRTCAACAAGFAYECPRYQVVGFHRPGALAERVVLPADAVVALPESLTTAEGAALQPLSSAVLCHTVAGIQPGESVAFVGGGVMGLLGVQVARAGNAGFIAVITRDARKLALAERFGADLAVPSGPDAVATVREATRGIGPDVVFETAGGPAVLDLAGVSTLELAVDLVRRGGRIVEVGVLPARAEAPLGALREKYITLIHPPSGIRRPSPTSHTLEHAIRLAASGRVQLEPLISHRLQGLDATHEAIDITVHKSAHAALGPAQITVRTPSATR